jgi:hypothetical protein
MSLLINIYDKNKKNCSDATTEALRVLLSDNSFYQKTAFPKRRPYETISKVNAHLKKEGTCNNIK